MDSVYAIRLSRAACNAAPGGDFIDHGWALLKNLHAEGFDVIPREPIRPLDRRAAVTLNQMAGLKSVPAGEEGE